MTERISDISDFLLELDGLKSVNRRTYINGEIRGFPLSKVELEALDVFDSVAQDESLRLSMMLEPGDLQFANNYAILHSRTSFEDHGDTSARRKMLRLWLKMPNARQLASDFPGRNGFPAPSVGVI